MVGELREIEGSVLRDLAPQRIQLLLETVGGDAGIGELHVTPNRAFPSLVRVRRTMLGG